MRKAHLTLSAFPLAISFLGLVLVALLADLRPIALDSISWRRPLVGTVFSFVCILGILAGLFPSKCSGMFHFRVARKGRFAQESGELPKETLDFRGHHPNCGNFGVHVFQAGGMVFCAGCSGLILGAVLSIFGTALYFFLRLSFEPYYFLVFWAGFVGVSCGLLQYSLFSWGSSFVHLFVNAIFVLGVFLLLVGVDAITQNTIMDLYLVALSVFWLYTRILLSQRDHRRICSKCSTKECEFSREKKLENGQYLRLIP